MKTVRLALFAALALPALAFAAPTLSERIAEHRQKNPRHHDPEIAAALGVSEAELNAVAAGAVRLRDGSEAAVAILTRQHELGETVSLTRNDTVVLEVTAVADKPQPGKEGEKSAAESGLFIGPVDLRASFAKWKYAFAVTAPGRKTGTVSRAFRFFNAQGAAIHKIIVPESGAAAFEKLVADLRATAQDAPLTITPATPEAAPKPDDAIDRAALAADWDKLTDAHQFSRMIKKSGATREQALRLAGPARATPLAPGAIRAVLDGVAAQKLAVLAFVSNGALTQIYTGGFEKTAASGDWYNVLDPKLNIHIREKEIVSAWLVRKPVEHGGILTDVEFFDAKGRLVIQFYGKRARGKPEPEAWRKFVESLPVAEPAK